MKSPLPPLPPGRSSSQSRFLQTSEGFHAVGLKRESSPSIPRPFTPPGLQRVGSPTQKTREAARCEYPPSAPRATTPTSIQRIGSKTELSKTLIRKQNRSSSLPPGGALPPVPGKESANERLCGLSGSGNSRERREKVRASSRGREFSPLCFQPKRSASEDTRSSHQYEEECQRLLVLPKFARLAQSALHGIELDFGDLALGDVQFGALLRDKTLVPADNIKCWKMCGNRLTHVGANALASVLTLKTGVIVLNLARNDFGIKGVESLRTLTSEYKVAMLRSLNLSRNGLKSDAVAVLCDALLECTDLLRLDLNCNDIREGSPLGKLVADHPNLLRLAVHGNYLLAAGGAALFRGVLQNIENDGKLSDLDVAWNGFGEGDATDCTKVIAGVLARPSSLFHLDLSYNSLDAHCCEVIATAMRNNHQLYGLHMVGNAVMIDSNGFLTPLTAGERPAWAVDKSSGMMFGDPRSGPRQLVGSARRSSCANDSCVGMCSDDDILRDRDPLEHQTTCWACEGWEKVEITWFVVEGQELPKAVWAFTSLDNFRSATRLRLDSDGSCYHGTRMVPPGQEILVAFQVDNAVKLPHGCEIEQLVNDVSIDLCICKELHKPDPPIVQISQACRGCVKRSKVPPTGSDLAGMRVVLLDGPDGPVQMPRITENEYRAKFSQVRHCSVLAAFRKETDKVVRKAFELDFTMIKKGRLIPDFEDATVGRLLETNYKDIIGIYRQLSAVSGTSEFGVTSLNMGNFATEAGLVDGHTTKLSDIDRLFIASNVMSSDQRKEMIVRNDKELVRFQFLEVLLRIADQRFRQTREVPSMTQAVERLITELRPIADIRLKEMEDFFDALHSIEVDDVYRDHLPLLEEAYKRFGGQKGPKGHSSHMTFVQFQDLLELLGAYNVQFQPRFSGVAFRMGMMTQADECYDSRFQEMSFLEFLHALGAVAFLRAGREVEGLPESLEDFFYEFIVRAVVPETMACYCQSAQARARARK